jgi:Domain of unknown function (DUF4381)
MFTLPVSGQETPQALEGLHDIVLPEAISYAPQTVGWYVLLALVVASVAWVTVVGYRRGVANRYRREALSELAVIESSIRSGRGRAGALARIPALLKRAVMSVAARADTAALSGEAWLAYLDGMYGGHGFTDGPGRVLPSLAYQSEKTLAAVTDEQAADLVDLVRTWIRVHRSPRPEDG